MITQFKIYENNLDCDLAWKVRIDQPYFDIICSKLGVPDDRFDFVNDPLTIKQQKIGKYIYIEKFCDLYISSTGWEWNTLKKHIEPHFKYMGEVKVTQEDIDEWNFKKNTKKYNL